MAGRSSVIVMVMIVATALFQSSQAQTRHVVGDSLGWTIPPAGAVAYSTWASAQNFSVGDFLVFNFTTGAHDVTKVLRNAFDGCSASNPISRTTNGPASITLTSAGSHYFICGVPTHCGLGQKLAINVSASSSTPAPQPSTPPTVAPPTPSSPSVPAPAPAPPTTTTPPPSGSATPPSPSSESTPPPSGSTTPSSPPPSGTSLPPPPPDSSAPSFTAIASVPVTLFSIAMAFLY